MTNEIKTFTKIGIIYITKYTLLNGTKTSKSNGYDFRIIKESTDRNTKKIKTIKSWAKNVDCFEDYINGIANETKRISFVVK